MASREGIVSAVLGMVAAVTLTEAASARVWSVAVDGSGDAPTIQAGIDSALVGDVVEIGPGTYSGPGNQDLTFRGKAIVVRSSTGARDTVIMPENPDPRRCFRFDAGEGPSSVLEDLTLKYAFGPGGAGIYCDGTAPTIRDCVITRCYAIGGTMGGAIGCVGGAAPSFSNCVIAQNQGVDFDDVGGFWLQDSFATFANCSFVQNYGAFHGVFFLQASSCVLTNCLFAFNFCTFGPLATCDAASDLVMECCDVYGNEHGDGCFGEQLGTGGNFSADPLLCDLQSQDYALEESSPCMDAAGCGLIGALSAGCGAATTVPELTALNWSEVKAGYR
jgi:Right handed beta helix region